MKLIFTYILSNNDAENLNEFTKRVDKVISNSFVKSTKVNSSTYRNNIKNKEINIYVHPNLNDKHIQKMDEVNAVLSNPIFLGKISPGNGISKSRGLAYFAFDCYDIKDLKLPFRYAIRIVYAQEIPISPSRLHVDIANELSSIDYNSNNDKRSLKTTVFSIEPMSKKSKGNLEICIEFDNRQITHCEISPESSSSPILDYNGRYAIRTNNILEYMDKQMSIYNAPSELSALEKLEEHYKSTTDNNYIKEIKEKEVSDRTVITGEMDPTLSNYNELVRVQTWIQEVRRFVTQEPKMDSLYYRVINPEDLKKYVISEIPNYNKTKENF